ncbi:MAG: endonuclease domain-containing protein [Planctomycetota bacterium]
MTSQPTSNTRERRKQCTVSEGLLWSLLRARQLCGLKFRREHPIAGFIADFACAESKLVVEVDGGYYDQTGEQDVARENRLREVGLDVLGFRDQDVERDAEAVFRAIARHPRMEYSFRPRHRGGSGMKTQRHRNGIHPPGRRVS